jgi:hypothetical protein
MTPDKWKELLAELSSFALADADVRERLHERQLASGWLGFPPADEDAIMAAERRLGLVLPPSYRSFLLVSNGWSHPNPFVARIAPVEAIGRTRDLAPDLVEGVARGRALAEAQFGKPPAGPDDDLPLTVLINQPHEDDDAASFMLNPCRTTEGEMEAWFFSNWNPGAKACPSFWDLMVGERDSWRAMV